MWHICTANAFAPVIINYWIIWFLVYPVYPVATDYINFSNETAAILKACQVWWIIVANGIVDNGGSFLAWCLNFAFGLQKLFAAWLILQLFELTASMARCGDSIFQLLCYLEYMLKKFWDS